MAAVGIAAVLLMLMVAVGGSLLLYVLIRAEHDDRQHMEWDDAQRHARRDTSDHENR